MEDALVQVVGQGLMFNSEGAAKVLATSVDPLSKKVISEIKKLVELQQAEVRATFSRAGASASKLKALLYLIGLAGLAFSVVCAWLLTRSITQPLQDALSVARRVAAGDLSSSQAISGQDEVSHLLKALEDMNRSLTAIVAKVRGGTAAVDIASQEMATANEDLSSRTDSQASFLEETAGSMEELTSTVAQNTDHARHANQLVASASDVAVKGGQVVAKVVATMTSIKTDSSKIGDIIGVIDGIAFQTNILALNAAVEAARAGEQGRGFAVVASEVRALAQRSAEAAKATKTLISTSVESIDAGSVLVAEAGKTMDEIVISVKQVADLIGEIARASIEQRSGIEQVNDAITRMHGMTQQNAATAEQAGATANSLREQAAELAQAISVFVVDGAGAPHASASEQGRPQPKPRAPALAAVRYIPKKAA
jgi:methyl-accepting chemotaxis protein